VSRALRSARYMIGHFRDESFHLITCSATKKAVLSQGNPRAMPLKIWMYAL